MSRTDSPLLRAVLDEFPDDRPRRLATVAAGLGVGEDATLAALVRLEEMGLVARAASDDRQWAARGDQIRGQLERDDHRAPPSPTSADEGKPVVVDGERVGRVVAVRDGVAHVAPDDAGDDGRRRLVPPGAVASVTDDRVRLVPGFGTRRSVDGSGG